MLSSNNCFDNRDRGLFHYCRSYKNTSGVCVCVICNRCFVNIDQMGMDKVGSDDVRVDIVHCKKMGLVRLVKNRDVSVTTAEALTCM